MKSRTIKVHPQKDDSESKYYLRQFTLSLLSRLNVAIDSYTNSPFVYIAYTHVVLQIQDTHEEHKKNRND